MFQCDVHIKAHNEVFDQKAFCAKENRNLTQQVFKVMFVRIMMITIMIAMLSRSIVQQSMLSMPVMATSQLTSKLNHDVFNSVYRRSQSDGGGQSENILVDDENENEQYVRTATGGFIYTLMVLLTILAYIGNAIFLIYVFWLSR